MTDKQIAALELHCRIHGNLPESMAKELLVEVKRLRVIEAAAAKMEGKLHEIFSSDAYHSVFLLAANHGCDYHGPTCDAELDELCQALGLYEHEEPGEMVGLDELLPGQTGEAKP